MNLHPGFHRLLFIALLIAPFCRLSGQVVAGISAGGKIIAWGDTVHVCQGSLINFQSVGQGSINITWRFTGASITVAYGIGPFNVQYAAKGYDTVWQKIEGGSFVDSTFLIVQVSDEHPAAAFSWSPDGDCGNVPVQFTDRSSGDHLLYSWNFGDGGASNLASPSYSFLNAIGTSGTHIYPVTLSVVNSYGCSSTTNHAVTVKNTPDASLGNADPDVLFNTFNGNATFKKCNNIPSYAFSFSNQSTTTSINTNYTIQWGDGSPDSIFTSWPQGVIITHTFPLGSSAMTVKINGANGCTGIKKYIVFLGSTPAGGLASLGNTDICASDSLRFAINNTAGNPPGTSYTFLINDGSFAQTFQHPAPAIVGHFFAVGSCSYSSSSGNSVFNNAFGAYLTIENPCGTTSPSVVPIYVSGKPRASIYVAPARTACVGTTLNIISTSTYGGVITATGGTGSVCTNSGKQVWTISPATGYTITSGQKGLLNGSSTNGALWTGGSGNLNVNFTTAGTYTVKLYVYNNRCGIDSTMEIICVRNPPQAAFTMPSRNRCGPGVLTPANTSPVNSCGGDAYSWQVTWLDPLGCSNGQGPAYAFTDGTGAGTFNPSLQLNAPGKYIIQLTVTALNAGAACSPSVYKDTFTVIGTPKVSIQTPAAACPNNNVTPSAHIDSCYSPGPFAYQWQFTGASPSTADVLTPGPISYSNLNTYPISLTVTDQGCNTSAAANVNISIVPPPVAFAGNDTTLCSGNPITLGKAGQTGVSYRWTPVAGLSNPAISNPSLAFNYTGAAADTTLEYVLHASLNNDCSATDTIKITVKRKPSVSILPATPVMCIGDSIQLIAAGADVYTWSPSPAVIAGTTDTARVKPAVSTLYTIIGRFGSGCPDTVTSLVTVHPDAKALFAASKTTICSGINLSGLITVTPYPGQNGQYTWKDNGVPFGVGTTGVFPPWSLGSQGATDTIRLVTTSAFGCRADSMEILFKTLPGVTAHFSKSATAGCGPLKVYLENNSPAATAAQFFWDFGNGRTSQLQQPDSIAFLPSPYHRDTTYIITLKAYNGCDTTIWKDSVKVYPDPWAAFTVSNILGCSPFTDTLINLSEGNNTSYFWDFGDGSTRTVTTPANLIHTYHAGVIDTFTIALTATNRCGTHTSTLDVVVTPNTIKPNVLINGNALFGCAPFTVNFVNNSSGAARIKVDFNDGSMPAIIPGNQNIISHQYLQPGLYNVTMLLGNSCADTAISRQVTVFTAPVPNFSLAPNPVCTGSNVLAANHSSNANAWSWDWGDSTTSNGGTGSHVYTKGGSYAVRLTASLVNDFGTVCRVTGDPVTLRVVDLIPARIDTGATRPCAPYKMSVTAMDVSDARSVDWTFFDNARPEGSFRASGAAASYQYNDPGSYKVMLVVQNMAGCSDTAVHSFYVSATPGLHLNPFNTLYTCNTDTTLRLQATADYTGSDALSWSWDINGTPAGAGVPFVYRLQLPADSLDPSNYIVRAMVANSRGCSDTATAGTLVIRPLPPPHILIRPDSVLYQPDYTFTFMDSLSRPSGVRYTWDLGDNNGQNTGRETSHRYGDTGIYYIKAYVSDEVTGCRKGDTTHVRIVYVPGFLYVPNAVCPGCAVGELRTFLPKGRGLKDYHLRIYNAWGQLIFETTKLDADGAPSEPWNARYNGQTVQQDAYRWQIEARYTNGTEWRGMLYPNAASPVKSGFITVVR
ncbi:MAG: PKD domain-containing protein [Chitinophagaceae bacterium]|nr:PKD domain-containing protein [Chitinophagaceae bacterium]